MRKRFESSDAIEIGLFNKVSCYYHLKYKFLPKKVRIHILWFFITVTLKDTWHVLKLYHSSGIAEEINPDNAELWKPVQFDITSEQSAQRYRNIKDQVKTYNDLDKLFQLTRRDTEYQRDKLCYNICHSK